MAEFYPEIREKKNELRAEYREKRRSMNAEVRADADAQIARRFLSSITYRNAKAVLLYASTEEEIGTLSIAQAALQDGKTVAFPRCIAGEKRMVFHIVSSLDLLNPGTYGLEEPDETLPVYDCEARAEQDHAVAVIPGVVFDREGFRVGYGKGYYDRFLHGFKGVRAGLAYEGHVLRTVPRGRFDMNVDVLFTEKGVHAVYAR